MNKASIRVVVKVLDEYLNNKLVGAALSNNDTDAQTCREVVKNVYVICELPSKRYGSASQYLRL